MKKMNKPEVEAVRFADTDVIATSVGRLSSTYNYVAFEVEYDQSRDYFHDPDFKWVWFEGSNPGKSWKIEYATIGNDYRYAWYDNGWFTENKFVENYRRTNFPVDGNPSNNAPYVDPSDVP